jgi:hypothetical protein
MNRKKTMNMLRIAAAVVAVGAAGAASGGPGSPDASDSTGLVWPLEGAPAVSSNFCEYREGHFHAGLDIRTFGAEGIPCIAAADGHVSRLRASPQGYGRALYVQLETGETLVYAHLAEFQPALEDALYEEQVSAGRYAVDLRFARGRFPVRRGDVIAWSGSTGGTAPHLHFEIRDAGENPVNPFASGFGLEDGLTPVFERVQFVPLGPSARIQGHCWPVELRATRVGDGRFALADTLSISGDVGVAAELFDRLNSRSGRLAPYTVTVEVDGNKIADIRLERFSFAHADEVDFLYDIARVRREKTYFVQLFASVGETMWNRSFGNGGTLGGEAPGKGVPDGSVVRRGVVTAADAAGNTASLDFYYREGAEWPPQPAEWENARLVAAEGPPGVYFRGPFASVRGGFSDAIVQASEPVPADKSAAAAIPGFAPPDVYTAEGLSEGPFELSAGSTSGSGRVHVIGVKKGLPTSVSFPGSGGGLQLIFGKRTLYDDAVFYSSRWQGPSDGVNPGELIQRAAPVVIGPYSAVLRADMEIRFSSAGFDSSSAIYRLNERKGQWVYYESALNGAALSTTARRPGVYGVFNDEHGPRIRNPFVRTHKSYATGIVLPAVVVPVEDTGSGVDHRRTVVSLDGIGQIAYWDSQAKKLFMVIRDPNIMGPHTIQVVAFDQTGNRTRLDATVEIPESAQRQGSN